MGKPSAAGVGPALLVEPRLPPPDSTHSSATRGKPARGRPDSENRPKRTEATIGYGTFGPGPPFARNRGVLLLFPSSTQLGPTSDETDGMLLPRLPRVFGSLVFCVSFVAATACHSALGGGINAFHHADYPLAARELRAAAKLGVGTDDTARYDLYAGLTHLALGDAVMAIVHLTRARATLDAEPEYFSKAERARLMSAWQALGKMPGQAL